MLFKLKKLFLVVLVFLLAVPANASSTLWDFYNHNLPPITERASVYENVADDLYVGTAEQNKKLLDYLQNSEKLGARTDNSWNNRGTYLETSSKTGYNILINGSNKYVNFGSTSGFTGYGIRNNGGDIEVKNSGGSWAAIATGSVDLTPYWKNDGTSTATGDWDLGDNTLRLAGITDYGVPTNLAIDLSGPSGGTLNDTSGLPSLGWSYRYLYDNAGVVNLAYATQRQLTIGNTSAGTLDFTGLSGAQTFSFPDASGTIALTSDIVNYWSLDASNNIYNTNAGTAVGIGAQNSGAGNVFEVTGNSYFSGNIGFGTPSSTYAYDFYSTLRANNYDNQGGFRVTDFSNQNGGYYIYAADDTTQLGGLYNIDGQRTILRLTVNGADAVQFDTENASAQNYIYKNGLVLNGTVGDAMNYPGLYVAYGNSYFANDLTVNQTLNVNGTFSPSIVSTSSGGVFIRGGVGQDKGLLEINRATGSTLSHISLGENGGRYGDILMAASTNDALELTVANSSLTDSGIKFTTKGAGTISLNGNTSLTNTAARTFLVDSTANTVAGRALTIGAGSTAGGGTSNLVGGNLILKSGLGTGTGASAITFSTGRTLTTGNTLQTLTEAMRIDGTGAVMVNNTDGVVPLSVKALTDYAIPTTNTRQGTFSVGNTTNAYGIIMGVHTASGKAWISSQRFSGGAANYPLLLNPLGSYLIVGGDTALNTAEGSINLVKDTAVVTIKSGGTYNTELTGTSLRIGQTTGTGYLYFKSDNSIGASMYWGKTSGAGVSFANTTFIPTSNLGFGLGDPSFRWSLFYSARISDNATNVGFLDATTPFNVGTGRGIHVKSDQLATVLIHGYYKDGTTTSYASQLLFYYGTTSQSRLLYDPGSALFTISNEYSGNGSTNNYGDILFSTMAAGGTTLTEAARIRGWNGNFGLNTGAKPTHKLTVYGDTLLGSATNYTTFDSTGHQTMVGTAQPWEDLRVEPTVRQAAGVGVPAFEKYFDDAGGTSRGVFLYSFTDESVAGNEKEVFFTIQMSHSWNGGPISLHVHFTPASTVNSTDILWGAECTWKEPGETYGDTTIITSSTTLVPDDANITASKHYIAEFADITPGTTADGLSSIAICRLFRNSSSGSDTYTDKVGLLYIDAHYQINSIGSNDEYTK